MAQFPRIHLTPFTDVGSSLDLNATCPGADVDRRGERRLDRVRELRRRRAAEPAPGARAPVIPNFIVNFGDRLRANFHVVLQDSRIAYAIENNLPVPTTPHIGGTLDGYFDFELARGRAAQPWP